MSELKAFTFGLGRYTEDGYPCVVACDGEGNPRLASDETFYLKSEADKVITHNKFKRCLDMVAYCDLKMSYWAIREIHEGDTGKFDLYSKWHKRWLELAEKFKETK